MKQFNSQQPDVKGIARHNGEGEYIGTTSRSTSRRVMGGIATQYPSADNLCFWGKK